MLKADMIVILGNVGLFLNSISVSGESNLNGLLAAIQNVRNVREALKEENENEKCAESQTQ